jgi:hypothetical protein
MKKTVIILSVLVLISGSWQTAKGQSINEIDCSNNISTPFPRPTIDVNKKKVCLPEITEECFTGKFIEYEIK